MSNTKYRIRPFEQRIHDYAVEHGLDLSAGDIRRAARVILRRQREVSDEDADLRLLGALLDPTPTEAIHNIAVSGGKAARRLGLVAS